jgi:hypothetical protein
MDKIDDLEPAPLLSGQFSINSALTKAIEVACEACGDEAEKDGVDLSARAWVWTNEAAHYYPFERHRTGGSVSLKDAVKRAMRTPSSVRWIEREKAGGGKELLDWATIVELGRLCG